jgi:hypothetical protein
LAIRPRLCFVHNPELESHPAQNAIRFRNFQNRLE